MRSLLTGAFTTVKRVAEDGDFRDRGCAAMNRSVSDAPDRLQQLVEPLGRRREIAANLHLPVDEHQILAVEDLPDARAAVGTGTRAGLLAGSDLEALDHGGLERLLR